MNTWIPGSEFTIAVPLGHGGVVRQPMLVNEILQLHRSVPPAHGHDDILGDPYLLANNPVYRNVKDRAVAIGCTFVEAWPQYLLLPFNELHRIVSTKTVPYVATARLLRGVEDIRPHVFTMDDVPLPESYHLHEAAHVVAEDAFDGVAMPSTEEVILKTIMCESFANTVDALACVPATTDEHRFFLSQNCYMKPRKATMDAMARIVRRAGSRFNFHLTYMTYLHANFLRESVPTAVIDRLRDRYAPGVEVTEAFRKDCESIGRLGAKLDPLFRIQTTSVYFKMLGYDDDIQDLLDFPFTDLFEGRPDVRAVAERLADVVEMN